MKADASHPERVADLLAGAAELVSAPVARAVVEHIHGEVVGLVEDEDRAWHRALADLSEELEELRAAVDAAEGRR